MPDQPIAAVPADGAPTMRTVHHVRMARATGKDMEVGYELMALLDDMDRGYYPARPGDKSESGPTHFDSDSREHLEYLYQRIYEIADKSSSFGRIMGGLSVLLNPKNNIVDFTDDCVELSPGLKEAIKAKDDLEKFKAENDHLRGLLAEKVVDSTMLTGLEINSRGVDIGFQGGAARMLAEMLVEQFNASGAVNSLEGTFQDKELGQIVVTTQRMGGLTPAQQRGKAIAERDALLSTLVKIVTETMDFPPVKPTSADSWIPRELVSEAQTAITAVRGYPVPTHPTYRPAE